MNKESTNHESLSLDDFKTKPEVNCRAFNCILVYVEETYGRKALEEFISRTGLSLDYLQDQNHWVSWSYYCNLLETLVEWTGDPASPFKAGTYSGHKKSWGYLFYIFYAFGNVGKVLKKVTEIAPHINKGAEWTLLRLQKNKCTFRVHMKEGYPAKKVCCECRLGQVAGISRAFGMPLGKARETQCQALGADSCILEISWLNRPQRLFGLLGLVLGFILILILKQLFSGHAVGYTESSFILLTGYLAGRLLDYRLTEKGNAQINQEQTAALEESIQVIETKYVELQRAHDGLFAQHEISQAVTSTLRLEDIIKILLQMVVERLGFDRSLILLADEEAGILHQGRVFGDDSLNDFFTGLKVPLNLRSPIADEVFKKRQGRIVTREFIEGNEASDLEKRIFEITKTKEYVIVPLVSKDRLLGVLAADNLRSGKKITEGEKVLMVSLANQVAMAIENAGSFKTIEDLNVNLEKKVVERTRELEKSLQELKEAQEQLIHSEKMSSLGHLFSGLAHEINNPINFAYNGIAALRVSIQKIYDLSRQCVESSAEDSEEKTKSVKEMLLGTIREAVRLMEIIGTGLNRTRNLVSDLKHFSRKDQRDPEFLLIQSPIQSALTILNHEISGRIIVHKEINFKERIQGHPDQLNQVFMNILHNAIQAIPDKGNIWIDVEPAGQGEVRIRIRDDGIGIRPEDLPKVFEPFFTTKKRGEGTGLGMSICQRIIENHGGRIELTSEAGKGTEVIMTLPVRLNRTSAQGSAAEGITVGKD